MVSVVCMILIVMGVFAQSEKPIKRTSTWHRTPQRTIYQSGDKAEGNSADQGRNTVLTAEQEAISDVSGEKAYQLAKKYYDDNSSGCEKWFRFSAEKGYIKAQRILGYLRLFGDEIIDKKEDEAAKWLTKAAERGDEYSLFYLGYMYKEGIYFFKNEELSNQYLSKSAPFFYKMGKENMECSGEEALQYFELVRYAEVAPYDIRAAVLIGYMYYYGKGGVAWDFEKATSYFAYASEQGDPVATYFVGLCLETGHGIEKNISQSKEYYKVSGIRSLSEAIHMIETSY